MKSKDKLVTESILDKRLLELKEDIREEIVIMRDYLDEKSRGYRDEILTRFDDFTGRVQTLEDDNVVGAEHTRELRKDVDDHGKRITILESKTA